MDSIKNILPHSLVRNKIRPQVEACNVLDEFRKLVKVVWGEDVAKMATPKYVKEKVLYIQCDSPTVASALSLARKKIIEEINKNQGQEIIIDLVLR